MRRSSLVRYALLMLLGAPVAALAQTAPPAAPAPVPFPEALLRAAGDLFSKAQVEGDRIELVIDPLIDGVSGAQSTSTRSMQQSLIELVGRSYPRFSAQPFSSETLA